MSRRHGGVDPAVAGLCLALSLATSSPVTSAAAQSISTTPATGAWTNGGFLARRFPTLSYRGGPFLRRPRIVTVTFNGDDAALVSRMEHFGDAITRTAWWRAVIDGYCASDGDCIGEGRPGLAVRLHETLPAEVHAVDVSALLRRAIAEGRFGTLDDESLLLVYLPAGVGLKDAFVPRYCGDGPRGFHRSLRLETRVIGYAVMPRCGDEAALTGTASHELLETVMNPDTSRPAFVFAKEATARGFAAAGDEAMDPCGFIADRRVVVESTVVVRRAWSARAVAQGHDPCVPAISEGPYLALVPEQPTVRLVNSGDTVAITVEAAADRPVDRWTVAAVDLTGSQQHEQYVDVALDRHAVAPGETATLRVTLRKLPPRGIAVVGLVSARDGRSSLWPLAIITR